MGRQGPHNPTPTIKQPQGGGIEQAGDSCTRWGRTATVCMITEDKEKKGKKNHAEAEKKKTMKTRVQRRKRRPLGSVFVGQRHNSGP